MVSPAMNWLHHVESSYVTAWHGWAFVLARFLVQWQKEVKSASDTNSLHGMDLWRIAYWATTAASNRMLWSAMINHAPRDSVNVEHGPYRDHDHGSLLSIDMSYQTSIVPPTKHSHVTRQHVSQGQGSRGWATRASMISIDYQNPAWICH